LGCYLFLDVAKKRVAKKKKVKKNLVAKKKKEGVFYLENKF
jgi:hypothetical protein